MKHTAHSSTVVLGLVLALTGTTLGAKPRLGRPAPDFSLVGLNGLNSEEKISLSAYHGKVVLLDFWASWCLPCRRLMPLLVELKDRDPDLEVLSVSIDQDKTKALSFLRDVVPGLKAAYDGKQKTAAAYGVNELMPACFLIDKSGRLRFAHSGYTAEDMEAVEREANLLLSEPEKSSRK
jgi:cytochrome c biogenesis protein CcmG/thiol:disulfide interchange protein DsbE